MKLYVGNLSFETTENQLQDAFGDYGDVREALIVTDKITSRPRGFGFVTMGSSSEGQAAINGLDGKALGGRNISVNEARPREDRPQSAGHGGGRSNRSFSRR